MEVWAQMNIFYSALSYLTACYLTSFCIWSLQNSLNTWLIVLSIFVGMVYLHTGGGLRASSCPCMLLSELPLNYHLCGQTHLLSLDVVVLNAADFFRRFFRLKRHKPKSYTV